MRIAVTGSVATDHLMTFGGRFADSLMADRLDSLSVSFLVDDLEVRRGGVGANIAFGLGSLGLQAHLVAAVGKDFDEYRSWLDHHGVNTDAVSVSEQRHTARFVCTTDQDQNQIASFYAGAMTSASEIELGTASDRAGGFDFVIIGADDPAAMANHTELCRQRKIPFAADPSQQLSSLNAEQIEQLVDGANVLFSNQYEAALIERRTGWTTDQVLSRVSARVVTLGAKGAVIERKGGSAVSVQVPQEERVVDPTGVGDAFRAGYLAGIAWQLDDERCAQLGCMVATYVVETVGPQEYTFTPDGFVERFAVAYGAAAADEVERAMKAR